MYGGGAAGPASPPLLVGIAGKREVVVGAVGSICVCVDRRGWGGVLGMVYLKTGGVMFFSSQCRSKI
jgi:hypothetical protein